MALYLKENLTFDRAQIEVLTEDSTTGQGKNLYMKGIFIEGGVKNANQRVYPVSEISKAVTQINEQIKADMPIAATVYKILWERLPANEGFKMIEETLI
jgi:glycerol-3-phosphate dehydrogenase